MYHANPGKLEALHARFRDHTCKLFQKHGIELVGFWTPTQGEEAKNTLYYILAFPDAEATEQGLAGLPGRSLLEEGQGRLGKGRRARQQG